MEAEESGAAAALETLVAEGELVLAVVLSGETERLEPLESAQAAISSDAITTIRQA